MSNAKGDWTDLFRSFRMALDGRKLWLAFEGVVLSLALIAVLLMVLAILFHARGLTLPAGPAARPPRAAVADAVRGAQGEPGSEADADDGDVWRHLSRLRVGRAARATRDYTAALFREAGSEARGLVAAARDPEQSPVLAYLRADHLRAAVTTVLLALLVLLLVWSYYGAAIMRIAAVEYALGERIEPRSARDFAWRKHHCFYGAPLGIVAAVFAVGLAVVVAGLIGWNILVVALAVGGVVAACLGGAKVRQKARSPAGGLATTLAVLVLTVVVCHLVVRWEWARVPYVGEVVLVLLWPLAFLGGLVMVAMALWLLFGGALMAGALATSDTDTFDAWSRSFNYLVAHPWRLLFYVVVMAVHGSACLGFVYVVRVATEWATLWALAIGLQGNFEAVHQAMAGAEPTVGSPVWAGLLAVALMLTRLVLDLIVLALAAAYVATAATLIYFLMRRCADGTPISEVHLEPRDRELLGPSAEAASD